MIDLHSHILPGLDDGAATMEDSINMAKAAISEGITTIVATPHHKNGRYVNRKVEIEAAVDEVNQQFQKNGIDLQVLPGQECRIFGELMEDYHESEILTLNNSKYLFIEFPSASVPRYAKELLYSIQLQGIVPIIVHPERNQELMEHPDKLYELVKDGALTQVTAASVCGKFGKKIQSFTAEIIEANLTHFVASDAHNIINRNFHMKTAYDTIQEKYGEEMVYFYMENSQLVLENKHVMVDQPQKIHRRKKLFGLF
ncbi:MULTISPECIES: tyrosine-protein phosphatase [Bacillaceae]|uniref:Tyrosine-protein phosphatase n=1 Tax=Evansella alkalicola TaxID=745819 RepID=A0ABS6JWV5_9BACI|nr:MULTISPECIES: CpsB/CapC family capsule biosynthesis tyrosine phosphatase [Bacillaceae]MBU9723069.1 tyrosine protein phosphatase [Bacillus alkalicola]